MKIRIYLVILTILFISGCAEKKTEERIIAVVNNYKMTEDDFNCESREILGIGRMIGEVPVTKKEILDALITKEILIQEAVKENLDKEKQFMKAIELYWEQTLLKNLLARKSEEIARDIAVYDDDIKTYYNKMKDSVKTKEEIISDIRAIKEKEAMDKWIDTLRLESRIKINKEALDALN